jgi:predicted N-formylglutamate amidohydrolase
VSEATAIPGNIGIGAAERRHRRELWFEPFHNAVAAHLDARRGRSTAVIHSFTPVFEGVSRPWHAGVLFRKAEAFGEALAAAIAARSGALVGRNEPYRVSVDHDYTVPIHGDARGLPSVLVEVRQDLVSDVLGIERWSWTPPRTSLFSLGCDSLDLGESGVGRCEVRWASSMLMSA